MDTKPAHCVRPECKYPARFELTERGFEMDEYCTEACRTWHQYAVVVAMAPWSDEIEFASKQLVAGSDFLNARGSDPSAPTDWDAV